MPSDKTYIPSIEEQQEMERIEFEKSSIALYKELEHANGVILTFKGSRKNHKLEPRLADPLLIAITAGLKDYVDGLAYKKETS
jgi:hypothetical protein